MSQMALLPPCWSPLTCCEKFELFLLHSSHEEGQGRLAIGSVNRRCAHMTPSMLRMESVFKKREGKMKTGNCGVFFLPLMGPLPAGGWTLLVHVACII